MTDPLNGQTVLQYDAANQLTNRTLPNGVVTTFSYNLRGQLTSLVHMKNGTVLAGAAYERQGVGEPARITREDGSYVDLGYDHAHRLTNETHRASGGALVEQISYGYDVAGNRTSQTAAAGSHAYSYLGGHRLSTVTGPANQSFSWDTGGRVSGIARDGETLTLGYNSDDRLTSVSDGTATLTYTYDAQGRRVRAASGGSERRFVVAPMANSDLESPHLVTDGANAVLGGFAYVGGQPLMRYDANGAATYYLEDAMGSVIALADGAGVPTALFAYDGFGNVRAAAGATNGLAGVGGDYRFHGHWFEEATGLYHARARDYDARTGRFIERDPEEGSPKMPETLHPYAFAFSNPHAYSDPSGRFTLIGLSFSGAINNGLSSMRTASVNYAKNRIKDRITEAFSNMVLSSLKAWLGFDPSDIEKFMSSRGPTVGGSAFGRLGFEALCGTVGTVIGKDRFHRDVRVQDRGAKLGDALSAGRHCDNGQNPPAPPGLSVGVSWSVPDFIMGSAPFSGGMRSKSELVGEFKFTARVLYDDYVGGAARKPDQLNAILGYAQRNSTWRTALFIVLKNDMSKSQLNTIRNTVGRKAVSRGVVPLMMVVAN